jgi:hypothetical protein
MKSNGIQRKNLTGVKTFLSHSRVLSVISTFFKLQKIFKYKMFNNLTVMPFHSFFCDCVTWEKIKLFFPISRSLESTATPMQMMAMMGIEKTLERGLIERCASSVFKKKEGRLHLHGETNSNLSGSTIAFAKVELSRELEGHSLGNSLFKRGGDAAMRVD